METKQHFFKIAFFLLLSFFVCGHMVAQEKISITGVVKDQGGEPVIGAFIQLESDSKVSTVTDVDGKFSINAPNDGVLVISFLGYVQKEVKINGRTSIDVTMEEDTRLLDEVVVVGYGTQKKANLTGAVASIKMDDVVKSRPVTTTGALLQGVIPGLQVTQGSGEPGEGVSMNIRGTTSIQGGGGPLILVDNVPLNGPLNLINPSDIESVTVLKDGGAAAIYGARSAWGVVLVTTKQAKAGDAFKISYNTNLSFSNPVALPEKMNPREIVQLYKDRGQTNFYTGQNIDTWLGYLDEYSKNKSLYPEGYALSEDGTRYGLAEYDILGTFLGDTGFQQMHNVSFSGSSKRSAYRVSLGYSNSDGILSGNNDTYDKYNLKTFLSSNITNWLEAQVDVSYYKSQRKSPMDQGSLYMEAVIQPSYTPMGDYDMDGVVMPLGTPDRRVNLNGSKRDVYTDTRLLGRLIAKPIKGLTVTGEFTYDQLNQNLSEYTKRYQFINPSKFEPEYSVENSFYKRTHREDEIKTMNLFANYETKFGEGHNFSAMAGMNAEIFNREYLYGEATGMINNELPSITQGSDKTTKQASDSFNQYSLLGYFGRISYNYKGRYLVEFNGRYDGSSKFPSKERWGFFPSVSGAWRVTEEPFMHSLREYIPEFKIRLSYATVGNQNISAYGFIPGMSANTPSWLHNNSELISLNMPAMVRDNFTWETVETYNLGFDLSLLQNRLVMSAELYQRNTKDMLAAGADLPAVVGASAPLQNVANLKAQGFEIEANWKDKIGKVNYYLGFNLYNSNARITKMSGNDAKLLSEYYEGQRFGEIWGYVTDRFYTEDDFTVNAEGKYILKEGIPAPKGLQNDVKPGDILFKDLNDDGVIDSGVNTVSDSGDRKIIGNNSLRLQYGIKGGLSWNNFDFSFYMHGIGKRDVWMSNDMIFPSYYEFGTSYKHQLDYWTPENTNAKYPRLHEKGTRDANYNSNVRSQTKYLLNGAYLRVKNITLGYTLPKNLVQKASLNSVRLTASVENPFLFHHLPKGMDPSISEKSRGLGYPMMKTYSFGLTVDF